jgi:hypothetical protein
MAVPSEIKEIDQSTSRTLKGLGKIQVGDRKTAVSILRNALPALGGSDRSCQVT